MHSTVMAYMQVCTVDSEYIRTVESIYCYVHAYCLTLVPICLPAQSTVVAQMQACILSTVISLAITYIQSNPCIVITVEHQQLQAYALDSLSLHVVLYCGQSSQHHTNSRIHELMSSRIIFQVHVQASIPTVDSYRPVEGVVYRQSYRIAYIHVLSNPRIVEFIHFVQIIQTDLLHMLFYLFYRPLPSNVKSRYSHKGPLSRTVTLTYPYNPYNKVESMAYCRKDVGSNW